MICESTNQTQDAKPRWLQRCYRFSLSALLSAVFLVCGETVGAKSNLTLVSGETVSGVILRAGPDGLTVLPPDAGARHIQLDELDGTGISTLDAWKKENPALDNVHWKFDNPPVPTRTVEPKTSGLPKDARGIVSVGLVISDRGRVVAATALKTQHPALEEVAVDAVQKWTFKPAAVGGSPVSCYIVVPVRFN